MAGNITCMVCDGHAGAHYGVVNRKRLWRCGDCGLIFAHPRPTEEEIGSFYESSYYDPYLLARETDAVGHEAALDEIEKRTARGSLLDVGCGIGRFLEAARERGWEIQGVDPSPWPAAYARRESGLPVECVSLEAAGFQDDAFDVVTLWSTVEHLADPLPVLLEARRVLRPGGALWVSVPNARSLGVLLHGERDHNLAKPEHLFHFTEATLRRFLAQKVGLGNLERIYLWGDRDGFVRNTLQHLARRTKLGSEIRMVGRKPHR
jgi:2-polyprenyl-3-methyl-5-hydroxy-6-metoxy-1,4-benzoquinol methylase